MVILFSDGNKKVKSCFNTMLQLRDQIKESHQRFCDGTSMHGFREMYYAKTHFWTIIWVLIVGGALGVTIYQVSGAIDQYLHKSSSTLIQPATKQDLTYPPLKFCVAHWVHWIDWDIAASKNYTKPTMLVGMSYLTNVYSTEYFNVSEAKENFTDTMAQNNISTIESFYKSISRLDDVFPGDLMTEIEFVLSDENLYFCYKAIGSEIYSFLQKPNEEDMESNDVELSFGVRDRTAMVDDEEYNSYMAEWIYENTKQYYLKEGKGGMLDNYAQARNNYSKVHPPDILFIDGYSKTNLILATEIDEYYVNIKASAQKLKNKSNYKCKENAKSFVSDSSCTALCTNKASDACGLSEKYFSNALALGNSTEPSLLTKNKVYFFDSEDLETFILSTENTVNERTTSNQIFLNGSTVSLEKSSCKSQAYNQCISTFCSVEACEKWTYDVTVTTRSLYGSLNDVAYKSTTSVYVHYPQSSDVLIMTEMDSKSWEDFIGNVGGLLGIWTGASIISFLQFIYLFFCVNVKCQSLLSFLKSKEQYNNRQMLRNVSNLNYSSNQSGRSSKEIHQILRRKKILPAVPNNNIIKVS